MEEMTRRIFEAFPSGYDDNFGEWEKIFLERFVEDSNKLYIFSESYAESKNMEIISALTNMQNTLNYALETPLQEYFKFYGPKPEYAESEKHKGAPVFVPPHRISFGFLTRMFPKILEYEKKVNKKAYEDQQRIYNEKLEEWKKKEREIEKRKQEHEEDLRVWEEQKAHAERLASGGLDGGSTYKVQDHIRSLLSRSEYPKEYPKNFDISYILETKTLLVDYELPTIKQIPTLKAIKYVRSKSRFKVTFLSEKDQNKNYDSLLYQIALRTIYEIYSLDSKNILSAVVFNGYINTVNKGTGDIVNVCIMSVQATKEEFLALNLINVDPKECFKKLKGVGSSKLHGVAAVAPIQKMNKNDSRFVVPYDVANTIDETTNLAAMDWQDFENLIREIFDKEFTQNGGEVKITQASRDRGVDAIAFDPDPIRGGKIVIQAKRYTNTVGSAAVRELYGTVLNEGATKGILVTTTNYGPDAYEFAKGKPLKLMTGAELLYLLEKHGHKAKIDIQEAKKTLKEMEE